MEGSRETGSIAVTGLDAPTPGRQAACRSSRAEDQSDEELGSGWQGLPSILHRNKVSRGFRKWGRGRHEIYDCRMSQPQMGKKTPCRGSGLFPRLHCPSWKDSPQTQVSHCPQLAVSPQGELQVQGEGRWPLGENPCCSACGAPDAHERSLLAEGQVSLVLSEEAA